MEKRRNVVLSLSLILLTAVGCVNPSEEISTAPRENLEPCPNSPNCISTKSSDPTSAMKPLPYVGTREQSRKRLVRVLRKMKRCKILTSTPAYLHVEFSSTLLGFVVDVEFLFDNSEKQIHFRSASRTGYYDFGVNRRRMKKITRHYFCDLEESP